MPWRDHIFVRDLSRLSTSHMTAKCCDDQDFAISIATIHHFSTPARRKEAVKVRINSLLSVVQTSDAVGRCTGTILRRLPHPRPATDTSLGTRARARKDPPVRPAARYPLLPTIASASPKRARRVCALDEANAERLDPQYDRPSTVLPFVQTRRAVEHGQGRCARVGLCCY